MNAPLPRDAPERVKLRVEDFMLLDAAGGFDGTATTELIDGEIIGTRAHFVQHGFAKSRLAMRLADALNSLANNSRSCFGGELTVRYRLLIGSKQTLEMRMQRCPASRAPAS